MEHLNQFSRIYASVCRGEGISLESLRLARKLSREWKLFYAKLDDRDQINTVNRQMRKMEKAYSTPAKAPTPASAATSKLDRAME